MLAKDREDAKNHIANAIDILLKAQEILLWQVAPDKDPPVTLRRPIPFGHAPPNLLDLALAITTVMVTPLIARQALNAATSPRDWLFQVYRLSCAPRGITEPVTTLVVMFAAIKFGMNHQLLLNTEDRLRIQHKTAIPDLDLFLDTFISEIIAANPRDINFNEWLHATVPKHYPNFENDNRLILMNGDSIEIPADIEPIEHPPAVHAQATPLYTSPLDPNSHTLIPPGSGYRITQKHGDILEDDNHPQYDGQHHTGIDITRWNAYREPVYAMRAGVVIDSVYLPRGFGNTITMQHDDASCMRYTHLDKKLVKLGDQVRQGQQIGTIGKGAKNIFSAHLHLDMPSDPAHIRAGSYYKTLAELANRFIDPLIHIPSR